jgi:hypothetical protein
MDLRRAIQEDLYLNCNWEDTPYHWLLAFILFVPVALTAIFFGISWYTKELYYLVLSIVLALDIFLNFFISGLYFAPAPIPTCGGNRAFPSFKTEHSCFLYTFMILSRHFFYLKLDDWAVFWLQVWVLLTWIASVELGYNNFKQALVGAVIGHSFAFVVILIVAPIIAKYRKYFMYRGLLHWMGYHDTIFEIDDTIRLRRHELGYLIKEIDKTKNSNGGEDEIWQNIINKLANKEAK